MQRPLGWNQFFSRPSCVFGNLPKFAVSCPHKRPIILMVGQPASQPARPQLLCSARQTTALLSFPAASLAPKWANVLAARKRLDGRQLVGEKIRFISATFGSSDAPPAPSERHFKLALRPEEGAAVNMRAKRQSAATFLSPSSPLGAREMISLACSLQPLQRERKEKVESTKLPELTAQRPKCNPPLE